MTNKDMIIGVLKDTYEVLDFLHVGHDGNEHRSGGNLGLCPGCEKTRAMLNLKALMEEVKKITHDKAQAEKVWESIYNDDLDTKAEGIALILAYADEIRADVADIAIEWVNQNLADDNMPIMLERLEEGALRAAITGKETTK